MPSLQDGGDWGRALFPGFHPGLYSFAPSGSEVREPWESWYPTLAKEAEARKDWAPGFAEAEEVEYVEGFRDGPDGAATREWPGSMWPLVRLEGHVRAVQLDALLFTEGRFDFFPILRLEVDVFPIKAVGDVHSGMNFPGEVVVEEIVAVQDLDFVLAVLKGDEVDAQVAHAPGFHHIVPGVIFDGHQARGAWGAADGCISGRCEEPG